MKLKRTTVFLTEKQINGIARIAASEGISSGELIRRTIEEFVRGDNLESLNQRIKMLERWREEMTGD